MYCRYLRVLQLMSALWMWSCSTIAWGQPFQPGIGFALPPFDSSSAAYLPPFPALSIDEPVQVSEEGHFSWKGQPIRFWGVNLTTGACFPDTAVAGRIAARMRKMGINLVRLHHMDNPWTSAQASIFLQNGTTTVLNPLTLHRLHYLVAQLKAQGIFVNVNLHVSRTFTEADGVLHADSLIDFGKAVTLFDRQLIHLQKQYAAQLLAPTNPYTGLPLAADPVVAMIEITNENTLYGFWKDDALQPFAQGGKLLQRHADTLDQRWHEFLLEKYGTQQVLAQAWGQADSTATTTNILLDAGFESGNWNAHWTLELHDQAQAQVSLVPQAHEGSWAARIEVSQVTGTDWHVQFKQAGFSLNEDTTYVCRFAARADQSTTLTVGIMRDEAPWTWYAGTTISLDTGWQQYSFAFVAPEDVAGLGRLTFILGHQAHTYYLDAVQLGPQKPIGLEAGEQLDLHNIRRIRYSERLAYHPQRVRDMAAFYLELQQAYYQHMYAFLRDTLGVQAAICGSNALGGPYEPYTQRTLDYIDDHAYWDHPVFPGEPWSPTDWYIQNRSALDEPGLGPIPHLFGGYQLADRPYTVSEYNHPFPNRYQTEMLPMLMGYGSLHGADALIFFQYADGDPPDWTSDMQRGYFDLHRNTPVMVLFPLFAYVFRQKYLEADPQPLELYYSPTYLVQRMPFEDELGRWGSFYPYDPRWALIHGLRIASWQAPSDSFPQGAPPGPPYVSHTGELWFDPELSVLLLSSPRFESITGNMALADAAPAAHLQVLEGEDYGTVALLSLTDEPLGQCRRAVLAWGTRLQNTGMQWDGTQTIHDDWGMPPTQVHALPLTISLFWSADSLRIYPLDPTGMPQDSFDLYPQPDGSFQMTLSPASQQTFWWGIRPLQPIVGTRATPSRTWRVFPNPSAGRVIVQGPAATAVELRLYSLDGRLLWRKPQTDLPATLQLPELPAGSYVLELRAADAAPAFQHLIIHPER